MLTRRVSLRLPRSPVAARRARDRPPFPAHRPFLADSRSRPPSSRPRRLEIPMPVLAVVTKLSLACTPERHAGRLGYLWCMVVIAAGGSCRVGETCPPQASRSVGTTLPALALPYSGKPSNA